MLLGNLKSSIQGTYHDFNFSKYATRYLAMVQYRFNRCFEMREIIPRLVRTCADTLPCVEKQLRLVEVCS